jgi:coenzyme F420-0:L-glutamate ligase / coenzyme F420-1:gamma-L-glutamate ligase
MSGMRALSFFAVGGLKEIVPGDDLAALVAEHELEDGDVVIVAQKAVSKAEGRYVDLRDVVPSQAARDLAREVDKDPRLVEVVLGESTRVVRKKRGLLIVEHRIGVILANAGVDVSNVAQEGQSERVLLLPVDPDASAERLREALRARAGVEVGVIVSDSLGRAWRQGTVGFAIGAAGVASLLDLRGTPDRFGRPLQHTTVGRADELAAAASILMGQAAEGTPVVVARGYACAAPHTAASALVRPREEDVFR